MLTFEVVLRLLVALVIIVGGLLLVRWWTLRGGGRTRGIDVVARAQVGRSSSLVVVDVAGCRFLVGAAEQSVNLIAELDAEVELGAELAKHVEESSGASDGSETSSGLLARSFTSAAPKKGEMPRIGVLAQLRRMTTRVPQGVRIHGLEEQ